VSSVFCASLVALTGSSTLISVFVGLGVLAPSAVIVSAVVGGRERRSVLFISGTTVAESVLINTGCTGSLVALTLTLLSDSVVVVCVTASAAEVAVGAEAVVAAVGAAAVAAAVVAAAAVAAAAVAAATAAAAAMKSGGGTLSYPVGVVMGT